ncbi:hypothetical protein VDF70_09285 [Xanthomonas campestris pv. raphani]|uniref:hypothetical protein n=1 Tax=Xanthomonas campestris TaxID=339 RepID=UPI002B23C0FB|nr:hypothetical protein [Xanthomonas campestris]MEA9759258.1 hypothetical protein [Xanthomonas campestris pv. raphani]
MGEVTAGGAHPSRSFKISDQFVAVVPYARSVSPITHGNWRAMADPRRGGAGRTGAADRLPIKRAGADR